MKCSRKMRFVRIGLTICCLLAEISGSFAGISVSLELSSPVGNLYILTIGIDEYQDARFNLKYAKADAVALADEFEKRGTDNPNFKAVKKTILLDSQATKNGIVTTLDALAREVESFDTFIFSFSGIGGKANRESPEFNLFPADGRQETLAETGITNNQLQALFRKIRAKNKLVILDSCESAGGYESAASAFVEQDEKAAELNRENILFVGADTKTFEFSQLGHGVITQTILDGIKGDADLNSDGTVSAFELEAQIYKSVFVYMAESKSSLHPRTIFSGENFPISSTDAKLVEIARRKDKEGEQSDTRTIPDEADDTAETTVERKGSDYAILFANDVFNDTAWKPLKNPQNDANDIAKELTKRYGFKEAIVKPNLTKQEIYDTIEQYQDSSFKNFNPVEDQLFIFFAGHGIADRDNKGFYVGRDSVAPKNPLKITDEEEAGLVKLDKILTAIDRIPLQHIMVVFDACYAGQIWKPSIQLVQENASLPNKSGDSAIADFDFSPLVRNVGASGRLLNFTDSNSNVLSQISKLAYAKRKMKERTRRVLTSGDKPVFDSWKKADGTRSSNSPFADGLLRALRTDGGELGVLVTAQIVPFIDKLAREPQIGKLSGSDGDFVFVKPDKSIASPPR